MSIHDIAVNRIDGTPTTLGAFRGRVALIVNTASECGLTPQYEGLEQLQARYHDRGFDVLGFPANEFGAQEPGTNAEIAAFCRGSFGVTFPMFEKIVVKGEGIHPLYQQLTQAQPGDVTWNFEKFLVGKDGTVVARFAPDVTPLDPAVTAAIERALAADPRPVG